MKSPTQLFTLTAHIWAGRGVALREPVSACSRRRVKEVSHTDGNVTSLFATATESRAENKEATCANHNNSNTAARQEPRSRGPSQTAGYTDWILYIVSITLFCYFYVFFVLFEWKTYLVANVSGFKEHLLVNVLLSCLLRCYNCVVGYHLKSFMPRFSVFLMIHFRFDWFITQVKTFPYYPTSYHFNFFFFTHICYMIMLNYHAKLR